MSKQTEIYDLAHQMVEKVTSSRENWENYLQSAAYTYTYAYPNQLLLWAQRPKAVSCATMSYWNTKANRWVRRGSHGIAILDTKSKGNQLQFVFDLQDTYERPNQNNAVAGMPWFVTEDNQRAVYQKLCQDEGKDTVLEVLENQINELLDDNQEKIFTVLDQRCAESTLEWFDKKEQQEIVLRIVKQSTMYMAAIRLKLDTKQLDISSFDAVQNFDTQQIGCFLGNALRLVAKPLLTEIGTVVRTIDSVAKTAPIVDNVAVKQKQSHNEQEADNGVYQSKRLYVPEYDYERTADRGNRQVRQPAPRISEGERSNDIRPDGDGRNPVPASAGNRKEHESSDRGDHREAEEKLNSTEPENRSRGLDTVYEWTESAGRGDGPADVVRPVTEQTEINPKAESDKTPSAFSLPDVRPELVDAILCHDGLARIPNEKIMRYYQQNFDLAERAEFIEQAYDNSYSEFSVGEVRVSYHKEADGLLMREGAFLSGTAETKLSWHAVAQQIGEYINEGKLTAPIKVEQRQHQKAASGQLSFFGTTPAAEEIPVQSEKKNEPTLNMFQQAQEDNGGFVITEKEISNVLRKGSGFAGGRNRIAEHFSQSHTEKENAEWLKKEYGIGGHSWTFLSGVDGWINYDTKGMEFVYGSYGKDRYERRLKWNEVAARVQLLIQMNRYLSDNPEPKKTVNENQLEQAKQLIEQFCAQEYDEVEHEEYADLHHVPIAYNTTNDEQYAVEIEADLLTPAMRYLVDGETVREDIYSDLQELIDTELVALDYDRMMADALGYAEEYLKNTVREGEPSLVEQMVDTPFVEQVMQDAAALNEPYHYEPINYTAPYKPEIPSGSHEKYAANIRAIKLLKQIEQRMVDGGEPANAEEQKTLASYCGWGGLADAFDPNKDSWSAEYAELKRLMTESEYSAARSSTLTAFYTPSEVIHPIYRALERMGVKGGNILDPAMGVGAFFGHKPSSFDLNSANLYGVELDSLTGRIARQLYQKAKIQVTGYEKSDLPESFFDAAVGNVPFGDFSVSDRQYDKLNFRIHDYFLAKTIDKLRSGGIMAFITSSGTMDKKDERVRKYLAARCELIGAVRLPNTTFKQNAGTEVTSDVLFFQKRDRLSEKDEPWLHLGKTQEGISVNQYFVDHPEMICGRLEMVSGPYGPTMTCQPQEGISLEEQIDVAMQNLQATLPQVEIILDEDEQTVNTIPADASVRNFSYTVKDDKLYYRENSIMREVHPNKTAEQRIRELIVLRDTVRDLLQAQLDDRSDEDIAGLQKKLNQQYDAYQKKHGLINSRGSEMAFSDDSSYFLLCSLEDIDDDGNFRGKTDLFSKRTVRSARPVDHVDTASDALALSIGEKACVDLDYMSQLTGKTIDQLTTDLTGVVFCDPSQKSFDDQPVYVTADEYLSGNVREKLATAKQAAEKDPQFKVNVQALEQVQPKDLDASEIAVRVGTTWIPAEFYKQFMDELMQAPFYFQQKINVNYVPYNGTWNISCKTLDSANIRANMTYGTKRANFYRIFEESLNLRAIQIYDLVQTEDGEKRVLNGAETQAAQEKQRQIADAFGEWIFKDQTRRQQLVKMYNTKFNSIRPREYDGSHIIFVGMNPEITLRTHQRNAIAHILYGGNTLLAHVVGAGKSATRS